MNIEKSKGSRFALLAVIFTDIFAAIMIMLLLIYFDSKVIPADIKNNKDITCYFIAVSMLLAEMMYPPIILYRRVSIRGILGRVSRLSILTVAMFALGEKMFVGNIKNTLQLIILYGIILYVFLIFIRAIERSLLKYARRSGYNRKSVVLIGSDPAILFLYNDLIADPSTGYQIQGYYSNDLIKDAPDNLVHLGYRDDLIASIKAGQKPFNADEVYCSLSHSDYNDIETVIRYCDMQVIQFLYIPRVYGNLKLNLSPVRMGNFTLFTNHLTPLRRLDNIIIKRTFDIVVSGIVCLFILPIVPIVWLMIKIQSPGPLLFGQERTGINGETFKCWKFRSMHVNTDSDKVQATKDDPRKFPFGNFMRKTNIDELPQFFNVLLGDMSIVGPRPHMLLHTDMYSSLIDEYMVRHFSKPGITGWAQITGFRGETKELWQMEERIKRDIWYNENWTFWLDIEIIIRTAWSIIHPDKNAY